ncbi:putative Glycoside hydrolase family 42 domain protein [Candidatus Sulfotelmatobacter kueseliae]|uniref:beta-galactosidase n=1 Tax=Candidatus Sulfotelmatobacter kueseliae TaxID=2042962 RepID=A0A2U3L5M9_9BACT|nr:putative Glycoside hydrolase family 42 domain protein [Candidatus Sulfotelmatobacter kueseliae]
MNSSRILSAFSLLLLAIQTGMSDPAPQNASANRDDSFFPVAVWYSGGKVRAPMLERIDASSAQRWGKDLDQIKADGFNTVKTWVDWATAERHRGDYNFANLDLLLRSAEERGLRVIVQVYLDSAPDWVGQRYPDGRFVDRSGAVIDSQAAPGYCIDHNGVRSEIVKFLEALSQDANKSPALYGWDVWSEPHVINWADFSYLQDPEFCFCSYSQARFREWLKAKYHSLDALNAAWYRSFENWDQVQPPRFPTILSYTDYLDWRAFIEDKLAADLKTRVDAIRSADSIHPITSHAAVPGLFTSPTDGYGEPDDWKMSASADFFGTSLYPKHSESTKPWTYFTLAAGLDFSRSAGHSLGKGFWIGELQAGQGATGMRIADPVTGHDERYWMWQVVAHGARELAVYAWYPMSSGFESNGYGLINLDGTLTERAQVAGQTANTIARHSAELLRATPAQAQVAILYNRLSYMVGGSQPSLSKLGNAERDSLLGLHRIFFEQNIPVDFVNVDDVTENRVQQYKLLFLPFPVMMSQDVADGVKRYVQGGGTAVAEARLAWNDARGFASDVIPGAGLAEMFGAREKIIRPADKVRIETQATPALPGLPARTGITGEAFEEQLEALPGGTVLAHFADGSPAMVKRSEGKGEAVLIGSFLALAYHDQQDPAIRHLFLSLAQAAGVSPDVAVSGAGTSEVEVRQLVGDKQQTIFVLNHSDSPADATLAIRLPWSAGEVREIENDQPVRFETRAGRTIFQKHLSAGEIWVIGVRGL